ncbi:hypothetical protein ACOMHN_050317 [Nucella lapillus]
MGCRNSKQPADSEASERSREMANFLSPEEMQLIQVNWAVIEPNTTETGIFLFSRLFELQEGFKKVFRRLMTQTESGHYVVDKTLLGHHADRVMGVLEKAVSLLGQSPLLASDLQKLGHKHYDHSVEPDMLPLMWPAVRDALRYVLEEGFTLESELAWKHLFDFIIGNMCHGIREAKLTGPPTSKTLPIS